jgi:hypothetical protein
MTNPNPEPPKEAPKGSTPAEKSAAQKADDAWQKAKLEEESGPQKQQFFDWLDEWAEKRSKSEPKPKTPQGAERPKSFMQNLFGDPE